MKDENKDEEDYRLEESSEFWRMIEERRREGSNVRLRDIESDLLADEA